MDIEDEKLISTALDYVRCGIGANYSRESFTNRMLEIHAPFSALIDRLRTAEQERDKYKAAVVERDFIIDEKNEELESLRAKIKEAQEPVGIARSDNSFLGNGDCYIDLYKDLDDNTLLYTKPVTQD